MKQMLTLPSALVVLLITNQALLASWDHVSPEILGEQAELIVEGIVERTEPGFTLGGRDYEILVIDVSGVLKGDLSLEEVQIAQAYTRLASIIY